MYNYASIAFQKRVYSFAAVKGMIWLCMNEWTVIGPSTCMWVFIAI